MDDARSHCPRSRLTFAAPLLALVVLVAAGCAGDNGQRVARAATQYEAGEYRAAAIELQNVLSADPDNIEASLLLGRVWLALGDVEAARSRLQSARELGASVEAHGLVLADALVAAGQLEQARAELDRVPPADRTAGWHTVEGSLQLAANALPAAEAAFRQALTLNQTAYDAWIGSARVAAAESDWARVLDAAESAVGLDAERFEAYLVRADAQIRAGSLAGAERDLQRAVDLLEERDPTAIEGNVFVTLAQTQLTLNRVEEMQATAARTAARAPDSPAATYVQGLAHFAGARYREAAAQLQQASVAAPADPSLPVLLGLSHLSLGNLGQAENHLLNALQRRPGDLSAVRALADARRRQGRFDSALEALDLAAEPDAPGVLASRGALYLDKKQPELAIIALQRAAVAVPGDIGVRLHLARAYLETGRVPDAVALFDADFGATAERGLEVATRLLAQVASDDGLDGAKAAAQQLVTNQQSDAHTLFGVALFYQAVGATDQVLELLQRAADGDRSFAPPRLALAGLALAGGETNRARDYFQLVVDETPGEFRGWLGLARLAAAAQNADDARRFAQRAAAAAPQELAPQLVLADLALASGDSAGAEAALAEARAIRPNDPDVATLSARFALERQQVDVALGELQRAANAEPTNVERWHRLGRLQLGAGNPTAAQTSLRRAVDLAPQSAAARFDLGQAQLALGNSSAARLTGLELQADFPTMGLGYVLEADILAAAGDHQGAARLFERGYEQSPTFELAARAYRARQAAGLAELVAPLERWLAKTPNDARAWLMLGEAHEAAARQSEALAAYERVISLEPNNVIALNNAAWIHNQTGGETAVDYARRALARAPQAPAVLDTYGWILLGRGDVESAVTELRKAALGAPDTPDIQYHFAAALARSGDATEARKVLESLLRDEREFATREQAAALLAGL